jgi:hypothetical protein
VENFLLLSVCVQLWLPSAVSSGGPARRSTYMALPVCAPRPSKLRLRGGSEDGEAGLPRKVPARVVLVPDDAENLHDAVGIIERKNALDRQTAGTGMC